MAEMVLRTRGTASWVWAVALALAAASGPWGGTRDRPKDASAPSLVWNLQWEEQVDPANFANFCRGDFYGCDLLFNQGE